MVRDQFHDPAYAHLFLLLEENTKAAEFVKHANLDDDQGAALPDSAFAWPEERRFPIHTAEHTVLSGLYRQKCAEAIPPQVDAALNKAAEIYGVTSLLVQEKTAEVAPDDATYILSNLHRLRVKTAADVQEAEKLLLEQYPRLSLSDRADGFINLVKVARDLNVSLKPETHRMAGMTVCTAKVAEDQIEARRMAVAEPLFKKAYEKLASAFRGRGEVHDRDELVTAADTLAQLDKVAGLTPLYDKKINDPVRTIFNTTKLAEETIDLAGREIPLSKLAELPATFWEDLLGKSGARDVCTGAQVDPQKLAQVVPTLPLDLKVVLKHQLPR